MKFTILFAVFFAVIAAVFAAPQTGGNKHLVGADKCTYGPAYWCEKRENAESCNAVKHCEEKVWNKN